MDPNPILSPSIVTSASPMETTLWNFYSGTHPHLNDLYIDPPSKFNKNYVAGGMQIPHHAPAEDREAFGLYYGCGSRTIEGSNPYITSAVFEVLEKKTITVKNPYIKNLKTKKRLKEEGVLTTGSIKKKPVGSQRRSSC